MKKEASQTKTSTTSSLRLLPEIGLVDGEPTWRPPMGVFGPETLPIRFRADAGEKDS